MREEYVWLQDGAYKINTDTKTFYSNMKNGVNYLKSYNLIVKCEPQPSYVTLSANG